MIIATAGHVDHGKTSLVRALTGVDTDRLPEEKTRGLTIDLGFAYTESFGVRLGFVDVPGHQRFLPNMLAGVAGIDAALLVVAADDGVMPQTREHLHILQLLGVPRGVVAITKCDRVTAARQDEVVGEVLTLCAGSVFADEPPLRVSTVTGDGLDALRTRLRALAADHQPSVDSALFRLAIDRVFTVTGAGTVVTGMVHSGRCSVGDELRVVPGQSVRVRAIRGLDLPVNSVGRGTRAALNLSGVTREELTRGHWVVDPASGPPTTRFVLRLHQPAAASLFTRWTEVHAHVAASRSTARAALLDASGAREWLEVRSKAPLLALVGDSCVIRDASARLTLCGGRVLDPYPPRGPTRRDGPLDRLHALAATDHAAQLAALLALPEPVAAGQLRQAWNVSPATFAADVAGSGAHAIGVGDTALLVAAPRWASAQETVVTTVRAWHLANPQVRGPNVIQLRQNCGAKVPRAMLGAALDACLATNRLRQSGGFVHAPDFMPRLAGEDRALWQRLEPLLAAGTRPPAVAEISVALGTRREALTPALGRLAYAGHIVGVADNRYFLPDQLSRLAVLAETLAAADGASGFTVGDFRNRSELGRNLAVDVLEYFDHLGFTRRKGDLRTVFPGAATRLAFRNR